MCIDAPGQVVERDLDIVTVAIGTRRQRASTLLCPDTSVGDWVYVAAGTVVERLDPADAAQITSLIRQAEGVNK